MKKSLLVLLAAVVLCMPSMAQKERTDFAPAKSVTFSQVTPFNMTTRTGETINMQNLLSQGKTIIIDLSCCWCGPCWNFHQTGTLEYLHENYGAPGTDEFFIIWGEVESTNTDAQITGTSTNSNYSGYTQGDWTNGGTIPYAIVDDATLPGKFDLYEGYVPTIFMIFPNGYYRDITSEIRSSTNPATAAAAVYAVKDNYPQAGVAPTVTINGPASAIVGAPATFSADIISVDPITSYDWSFNSGNPATASTATATTSWNTTGTYEIVLAVTNTTGTTYDTTTINVIEWGDTMYYDNGIYASSIGTGGGDIYWGAKFEASTLANRNYLTDVMIYVGEGYSGAYDLQIYQGGNDAPQTLLASQTSNFTTNDEDQWNTIHIYNTVALDPTKTLWVVFHTSSITYPAVGCDYTGNPNGSLVSMDGVEWMTIQQAAATLDYTWMIRAITSNNEPALACAIDGPTYTRTNVPTTYTANGPSTASYSWTIAGGTPATATGSSVTVTWANGGNYSITLTATNNGETATDAIDVEVEQCDAITSLPVSLNLNNGLGCWTAYAVDPSNNDLFGIQAMSDGSVAFVFSSYNDATDYNQYLITPELNVNTNIKLSFDYAILSSYSTSEQFSIRYSTTGNNISDFTNVVDDVNATAHSFTQYEATIPSNAKYIAINYYSEWAYYLGLKNITLSATNAIDDVKANVAIYPNPANDMLNVVAEGVKSIEIIDATGRVVLNTKNAGSIDISNLSNGIYMVRTITNEGVSMQKVIKK